jgi:hypothetical protein
MYYVSKMWPGKFDQGNVKFVRVSKEFELSEFELVVFYRVYFISHNWIYALLN